MKLKELLNEETLKILSEDSVDAIETALTGKVQLAVETALSEQDEEYSEKLTKLLEAVDKDCTIKLQRVVEAVDNSNANKLKMVVKKYNNILNEDAKKFKSRLVGSMSQFIDRYIDEAIPAEALNEAVKNKTATNVLANLREVLAVDSALMKESIKGALADGKSQMTKLQEQVNKLKKSNKVIREKAERTQAQLVLEKKTAGMSPQRKKHIMKTLGDKPLQYINENFDYAKDLIIRGEKKDQQRLRKEAFKKRKIQSDVVVEKSEPNSDAPVNPYLSEMKKFK